MSAGLSQKAGGGVQVKEPLLLFIGEAVIVISLLIGGGVGVSKLVIHRQQNIKKAEVYQKQYEKMLSVHDLNVKGKSGNFMFTSQATDSFLLNGWSDNDHKFAAKTNKGDFIDLETTVPAGRYKIFAHFTKSYDYGIVQLYVNGEKVSEEIDLFSNTIVPSGPIKLGEFILPKEKFTIRIEVVGFNENGKPPFYQFGVDGFTFEKI